MFSSPHFEYIACLVAMTPVSSLGVFYCLHILQAAHPHVLILCFRAWVEVQICAGFGEMSGKLHPASTSFSCLKGLHYSTAPRFVGQVEVLRNTIPMMMLLLCHKTDVLMFFAIKPPFVDVAVGFSVLSFRVCNTIVLFSCGAELARTVSVFMCSMACMLCSSIML
jgi:hypothetical protein